MIIEIKSTIKNKLNKYILMLSITRHLLLHSNAYDLGLFDQWIWLASKGEEPYSSMTGLHLFADHGAWTLYIASFVYKIFPSIHILLVSHLFLPEGLVL